MVSMSDSKRPSAMEHDFSIPPTEEERERLMDPDYWDWDTPVEVVRGENPGLRLTLRLERDDVKAIGVAARRANMPMDQYIKWAALVIANATAQVPEPAR
jgi:hypothetical protein